MNLGIILVILFFVLLLGALPTWPHNRSWGYYPGSDFGLVLLLLLFLVITNRI